MASPSRWTKLGKGLLISCLVLVFIEGLCSSFLFVWDLTRKSAAPLVAENDTEYDADLGWRNKKNRHFADLYGPGRSVTTNGQGFRNGHDFPVAVPAGRTRVICCGDSFTFGYGVDDGRTWVDALERADPQLETVNMGESGYGLDQTWLWYKRDGVRLDHQIALFAFISYDFDRVRGSRFWNLDKPFVRLKGDELAVTNVPVPQSTFRLPWLTQNGWLLQRLRLAELMSRITHRRIVGPGEERGSVREMDESEARRVAELIFADFARTARARGATPVLLLLPQCVTTNPDSIVPVDDFVRQALANAAGGIPFVDLTSEFAAVAPQRRRAFALTREDTEFPGAAGHYSEAGHDFVATALHARLVALGLLAAPR